MPTPTCPPTKKKTLRAQATVSLCAVALTSVSLSVGTWSPAHAQSVSHRLTGTDAQGISWFQTAPSSHKVPKDAPDLAVYATEEAKRARNVFVVVYLHGWRGCVRVLLASEPTPCLKGGAKEAPFALREAAEAAGLPLVFVVPQLSFWKRSGAPGRFRDAAYTKAWLRSIAKLELMRDKRIQSTTLVAHSAGFETALAIVDGAPEKIGNVAMLDALYDGAERLAKWLLSAAGRRALSLTLGRGDTWKQSKLVERRLRLGAGEKAVGNHSLRRWEEGARFKRAQASSKHRDIPRAQLGEVLRLLLPSK